MNQFKRGHLPPQQFLLDASINVVLFAGLGGACAGLEDAGIPVHVANNHDPVALAAHAALFPHTHHVRGDIFDVDPIAATSGRPVNLLWASPDCRDHSIAKGGAPRSARVRSLPWQVCRWAGKTRPKVIAMENVREIRGWGPLVAKRDPKSGRVIKLDGTVARRGEHVARRDQQLVRDKTRLGRSYRAFVRHLQDLGYAVEARDLCCADYGIPTIRRRWFAVARRDGRPIEWPEQTHAPAQHARERRLKPWIGAHTIIDWSIPMASIFGRRRPLAENTQRRIAVGLRKFVLENPRPFIVPVCHSSNKTAAHDGLAPLRTITTEKGGGFVVVAPSFTMPLTHHGAQRGDDVHDPLPTITAAHRGEISVVSAWMAQHNFAAADVVGSAATSPLATLTTRGTQINVTAACLATLRGTSNAADVSAPLQTVTAGGGHAALVSAFMVKYYGAAKDGQSVTDPAHSITTKDRHGLVTVQFCGSPHVLTDIRMRMLQPSEAAAAHGLTLPAEIEIEGQRRPLNTTEAMRLVGNSVPKLMARLIAEANRLTVVEQPTQRSVAA